MQLSNFLRIYYDVHVFDLVVVAKMEHCLSKKLIFKKCLK